MAGRERRGAASRTGLRTKILGLLLGVALFLFAAYTAFVYADQSARTEASLLENSRVLVLEMDAVWEFMSINQNAINHTSDGRYDYKGLHCAIVGKSVAMFFSLNSDYSMRFTNLDPRNIYNRPDAYEEQALLALKADPALDSYYGYDTVDGEKVFRYVEKMEVTEECLSCHGSPAGEVDETGYPKEGWSVGDMAGAVSVVVPTKLYMENMVHSIVRDSAFFLALMATMGAAIYYGLSRIVTRPLAALEKAITAVASDGGDGRRKAIDAGGLSGAMTTGAEPSLKITRLFEQFDGMSRRLADLYSGLEAEVRDRTRQLVEANEELERQRLRVEEANARLQRENRYKSDFLAIVSHELRTPLAAVLAFAELLEKSIPEDNLAARHQLEEIGRNGAVLLEMVDNVLETARIQAGSEKLNLELIDIADVVGMIESGSEPVARMRGVSFSTRVSPDVPLMMSDWEKVRRILSNLVSNAVKFTPAGGCVSVSASCCDLDGTAAVRVEVRDTGIGIPADKHDLVFERFTQENMSTVRRYGGSGLGLSLVKDLVAMLGGTVELQSEPGRGSLFAAVLPVDSQPFAKDGEQDR